MKIRQVLILYSSDCENTFYDFQAYINNNLAAFYKDEKKSDIKIEYASAYCVMISYLIDVPEDKLESF